MPREQADRDALEQFVRSVLFNLLEIRNIPEEWIAPWIARAFEIRNPIQIFNEMSGLLANRERLARIEDAKTPWVPGHFYSPIVSHKEVKLEWPRLSRDRVPAAVDLRIDQQIILLRQLVNFFNSIPFTETKSNRFRYYYQNPSYGFGDALIYWSMLNFFRPKHIVEVGSGFSSALALDTIDLLALPTIATFIDPYPEVARAATAPLSAPHTILPIKVQSIDLALVEDLEKDDILFIDSSHVVKTGSDVHFEITEMLPRLRPGVIVHFHDVTYPFEYGAPWVTIDNYSWNELYFLHTFLMYNSEFEIIFFNDLIGRDLPQNVKTLAPAQSHKFQLSRGAGLWLRRASRRCPLD